MLCVFAIRSIVACVFKHMKKQGHQCVGWMHVARDCPMKSTGKGKGKTQVCSRDSKGGGKIWQGFSERRGQVRQRSQERRQRLPRRVLEVQQGGSQGGGVLLQPDGGRRGPGGCGRRGVPGWWRVSTPRASRRSQSSRSQRVKRRALPRRCPRKVIPSARERTPRFNIASKS